ncbi:MAG TPA: hypothetical protein VFE60_17575 [Roseiarcus sp.]|nr:hypothetical protein [Roseiarcus sp.]
MQGLTFLSSKAQSLLIQSDMHENDRALREAGHWGVPAMVYEGEPFFGQDRFDMLVWRMKQRGLEQRQD